MDHFNFKLCFPVANKVTQVQSLNSEHITPIPHNMDGFYDQQVPFLVPPTVSGCMQASTLQPHTSSHDMYYGWNSLSPLWITVNSLCTSSLSTLFFGWEMMPPADDLTFLHPLFPNIISLVWRNHLTTGLLMTGKGNLPTQSLLRTPKVGY